LKKDTLDQTKQTIEHRINGLGVGRPPSRSAAAPMRSSSVVAELPGVDDPARVKGIMQTAAMLELCSVKGGPYSSRDDALAKNGGVLPLDSKLVRGARAGRKATARSVVPAGPHRGGYGPRPAQRPPQPGRDGPVGTDFVLGKDGSRRFARFTESNIGQPAGDRPGQPGSQRPRLPEPHEDSGRITGAANEQDASDLALVLREGSLPAGIQYPEERTVGPSLGAERSRRG